MENTSDQICSGSYYSQSKLPYEKHKENQQMEHNVLQSDHLTECRIINGGIYSTNTSVCGIIKKDALGKKEVQLHSGPVFLQPAYSSSINGFLMYIQQAEKRLLCAALA